MTFEPLDVVVVPFPFTDRRATKRRPALIVSSAEFNDDALIIRKVGALSKRDARAVKTALSRFLTTV